MTHTSHKYTERSTIEASITFDELRSYLNGKVAAPGLENRD
jgi:hypothetical protein